MVNKSSMSVALELGWPEAAASARQTSPVSLKAPVEPFVKLGHEYPIDVRMLEGHFP